MFTTLYLFVKSFFDKIGRDKIALYSATAAFYLILSVFPFIILLLTLIRYTPLTQEFILEGLKDFLPEAIFPIFETITTDIYTSAGGAIILVSAIGGLWSASRAAMALISGINACFNIEDKRNPIRVRLQAFFYTFALILMLIFVLLMLVFGSEIYNNITDYIGPLNVLIKFILRNRTIISFCIMIIFFMVAFKFLPAKNNKFYQMLPGAIIATSGWYVLSWLVSLYVEYFPNFTYTYGTLATFILTMLWLYTLMYLFFVCAEINFFFMSGLNNLAEKRRRNKSLKYDKKMETKSLKADTQKLKKSEKKQLEKALEKYRNENLESEVQADDTIYVRRVKRGNGRDN